MRAFDSFNFVLDGAEGSVDKADGGGAEVESKRADDDEAAAADVALPPVIASFSMRKCDGEVHLCTNFFLF